MPYASVGYPGTLEVDITDPKGTVLGRCCTALDAGMLVNELNRLLVEGGDPTKVDKSVRVQLIKLEHESKRRGDTITELLALVKKLSLE